MALTMVRKVMAPIAVVLAMSACARAQQSPGATSSQFERATAELELWRKGRVRVYMDDFGQLKRFQSANAKLGAPAPGESRVVFFGDSITENWPIATAFPRKPYVNRGIGGQTTSQMLVRFRNDVIALRPKVVVILAGTNDIAGNTGPITPEDIQGNVASMVELARAHGIRVVLSSVIPVHNYTAASELTYPRRPPEQIAGLNKWLKDYAAQSGSIYLDYAAAMSDDKRMLRRELAEDGLHPNKAGYAVMAPLAEQAIEKALGGG
jgi:lysophospholipase L1-like esterase